MAEQEDVNPRPFNPSPFCPIPLVIEPQQRIEQLRKYLEDPAPKMQRHRTNILGLIRMYETGEIGPLNLSRSADDLDLRGEDHGSAASP